jgi:hypothetical protein
MGYHGLPKSYRLLQVRREVPGKWGAPPLSPSLGPLHRYKLGKSESKLRSHPLQTRYRAVTYTR